MSSASSSLRCNIAIEAAPRLARWLVALPLQLAVIVLLAGHDLHLAVFFLIAALLAVRPLQSGLLLTTPSSVRYIRFSESRGWQLELANGERVRARLVSEPRAFRFLCALEFTETGGVRYSCLAGFFNCSDADLRSLNLLLHWSSQEELFSSPE